MPWPGEPWEGSCSRTGPRAHRLAHTVIGTPDRLRVGAFRVAWSDALGTTTSYIASAQHRPLRARAVPCLLVLEG